MDSEHRRRLWKAGGWSCLALGAANVGAYYAGIMPEPVMNSVTNGLSWAAMTATFWAGQEAATPNDEDQAGGPAAEGTGTDRGGEVRN